MLDFEDPKVIAALIAAISSIFLSLFNLTVGLKREKKLSLRNSKLEKLHTLKSEGFEKIWKHTGELNLFGSFDSLDLVSLSDGLKKWYFEHGLILGSKSKLSKDIYFLIQEALQIILLNSDTVKRPDDKELYNNPELNTTEALNEIRGNKLKIEFNIKNATIDDLKGCLMNWKKSYTKEDIQPERNWLMVQLLMSKFRSEMIKDLGF